MSLTSASIALFNFYEDILVKKVLPAQCHLTLSENLIRRI